MLGRRHADPFRLLVEQLPSAFLWTVDRELRLTSIAGGALKLLGVSDPAALDGLDIAPLAAQYGADDSFVEAHRRALEGESESHTADWHGWAFDVQIEPLVEDGDVVGAAGIAVDVTRRRVAEHALTESEARFRTLVERLPIATYVNALGTPIRTTYMSPYIEQMLGFPTDAWRQDDFYPGRLHPDDRGRVLTATHHTHATGAPFREEYRLIAADGSIVHVRDETIAVCDEQGNPLFLQGFLLEMDDRGAAASAEAGRRTARVA